MPKKTIKSQKYKILKNEKAAPDHFILEFDSKWMAKGAIPGQFVQVKAKNTGTDPLLRIPLGIHRVSKNTVSILYKVVGEGTDILSSRKKGEALDVLGPLGNGFDIGLLPKEKTAFLVAGGHGVAPLYFLAESILRQKGGVEVFLGACEKKHILCAEELKRIGAKVHIATECGKAGHKGYITELLDKRLDKGGRAAVIYACGPRPMLAAVNGLSAKYSIEAQVSLDEYMACGIGVCLGCAVATREGYKYICKDGPVFSGAEIKWEEKGGCGCGQ